MQRTLFNYQTTGIKEKMMHIIKVTAFPLIGELDPYLEHKPDYKKRIK